MLVTSTSLLLSSAGTTPATVSILSTADEKKKGYLNGLLNNVWMVWIMDIELTGTFCKIPL